MPVITLITIIQAPAQKVFDLARNIDLHQQSMRHSKEKAVGGKLTGLIEEGETVTWEAKHLFRKRRLTSKITVMKPPFYFRDEMIKGDFALLQHDHFFRSIEKGTEMKDVFVYQPPYGIVGKIAAFVFLTAYLRKILLHRNSIIKEEAELSVQ